MPGSITTFRMIKKTVGSNFASFPLAHCRSRVTAAIRRRRCEYGGKGKWSPSVVRDVMACKWLGGADNRELGGARVNTWP